MRLMRKRKQGALDWRGLGAPVRRAIGLALLLGAASSVGAAPSKEAPHVRVSFLVEDAAAVPGETLWAGLWFEPEDEWHVYWRNPGASGLPVEIEWDLPEGVSAGDLRWPAPSRVPMGEIINYGYEGDVLVFAPLRVDESVAEGRSLDLKARANWLVCREACVPGEAEFSRSVPVAGEAGPGPRADLFAQARERLPVANAPWEIEAELGRDALRLRLEASRETGAAGELSDVYFYADDNGWTDPNAKQKLTRIGAGVYRLEAPLAQSFSKDSPETVSGVLSADRPWRSGGSNRAWAIRAELAGAGATAEANASEEDQAAAPAAPGGPDAPASASGETGAAPVEGAAGLEGVLLDVGFAGWLALAFVGGVVLNLMPCVLPVLSLKVFSLMKHAGESRRRAALHGLAYATGVVASFVALAGALFALRAGGEQVGWGFQLQNPTFVVGLAVLFFLFGLNLLGVFEIGSGLVGADRDVAGRRDVVGSFGMGVLAAVVGAPCIGPFLAAVSGLAIQAPPAMGLTVFAFMGMGLAAPFVAFALFPKLMGVLPKPGAWMETFKQIMGFVLIAVVLALLWLLAQQTGTMGLLGTLSALFAVALAAWIFGRWSAPGRPRRTRWIARATALALLAGGTVFASDTAKPVRKDVAASASSGAWEAWSREKVDAALERDRPVFVDFTATWCLICQWNKRKVLRTDEGRAIFRRHDVKTLEADWTLRDPEITRELERFDRAGVPLYLLYFPGRPNDPAVLPQRLSPEILRKALEKGAEQVSASDVKRVIETS